MKNKVVIIGCGNVGMSYAYSLLSGKTFVKELVLIDLDKKRIEGEVMDLNHCLAFAPSKIRITVGDYNDCKDANIIVLSAGANTSPGESRMAAIDKNAKIFKDIVTKVMNTGFDGIFLVATNPLDVMTYLTWKYSNLPHYRVIGTGTSLDTARLRYIIGDRLNINPKNVHGYVVGEHGDSEFVPWSNISIGLQNIDNFLTKEQMEEIATEVRNAAYKIIEKKGATCYGIGMCLVRITNAILGDENSIITVSAYDDKNDIYIGSPCILNNEGIRERVLVNLNKEELKKLENSINTIKNAIKEVD